MALPGAGRLTAPTFADHLGLHPRRLQPEAEATAAGDGEPQLRAIHLQQGLQLRQAQGVLLNQATCRLPDERVEVVLDLPQNAKGDLPLVLRFKDLEQMFSSLPRRNID